MTQVHIHLLITHLPVFGSLIGVLVLVYGMVAKSDQTKAAAYYVFILSAVGASIAYFTGEGAEDAVENVGGIVENAIDAHEDFAIYALVALIATGILSILATYVTYHKMSFAKFMATMVLLFSLISFGLAGRTAALGGKIRHTEIASSNNNGSIILENEEQGDDD